MQGIFIVISIIFLTKNNKVADPKNDSYQKNKKNSFAGYHEIIVRFVSNRGKLKRKIEMCVRNEESFISYKVNVKKDLISPMRHVFLGRKKRNFRQHSLTYNVKPLT